MDNFETDAFSVIELTRALENIPFKPATLSGSGLFADVRALGARVSVAVRSAVLDAGRVWLDRAFVVNDWYIPAYEPIIDSFGKRVGMLLYVGFLDSPFRAAKLRTLIMIAAGFVVLILLSAPIFLRWARGIFMSLGDHAGDHRPGRGGRSERAHRVAGQRR